MTILEKIDKLRLERGWSINNLAMEAMLTQSTVNNLYMRSTEPKISTLRAICAAFNITLSEFFADEEINTNNAAMEDELKSRYAKLNEVQKKAVLALIRTMN